MPDDDAFAPDVPRFERSFFASTAGCSRIGRGSIGGKARGLVAADRILRQEFPAGRHGEVLVDIPRFVVIATDVYAAFLARNGLQEPELRELPDDRIAHAFQRAELPTEIAGDLLALVEEVRSPLAVRSSSLLEDALHHPFAGIYETKMTPNNQPSGPERFHRLTEAIKLVYASTLLRSARSYRTAIGKQATEEKMAVMIQEVVGLPHGERFYPNLSGVARSFNFYPMGSGRPEQGVVDLALGLGKTIVDGGRTYVYSPGRPKAPPPASSPQDRLKQSQRKFWAVHVGAPPPYDPVAETEYLVHEGLEAAEYDGTLRYVASTYVAGSDALAPGVGPDGPRVLDFAPLLVLGEFPVNAIVKKVLAAGERCAGGPAEVEFAMTLPGRHGAPRARFAFLQVRPMMVPEAQVEITAEETTGPAVLLHSDRVMGNGVVTGIHDVVYVRPDTFEARHTRRIATALETINASLLHAGRPYLLIGFGRWGSSDPWLGIPVNWGQICGAKVIVEATLPTMVVDPSQGSHFFHNITSLGVGYFTVTDRPGAGLDWEWLAARAAQHESELIRHVRLDTPLEVRMDGRRGRGVIRHSPD
ncbi:MAG: PEP/pyruvate-binding domain-containing protein [Planctomycetota bacterium]